MGRVSDFLNAQIGEGNEQRIGIGGFVMLARVRESYKYESETPTTYLEDGSSVEDHIILNPVTLSIEGEVADVYIEQTALQEFTEQVSSTAGGISLYLPERTQSQRQAVADISSDITDAISAADEIVEGGAQVAELFGSAGMQGKSLRERFVDTMEALHFGRQLVDVEMPYRTFSNMRLTVDISADNQRKALTFKIDAKQLRFADEAVSDITSLVVNASGAIQGQAESQTDKGVQEGEPVQDTSLLGTILGLGG